MASILTVCTANICRSPIAAAILDDRLRKKGLKDWNVNSAGTWAQFERGAARNSITVAREYELDITDHRAQMIDENLLLEADLILCMETGHVEALKIEFPHFADKVYLLTEMSGLPYSIYDPYGKPLDDFRDMAVELTSLIDAGLERIIQLAQTNANRNKLTTSHQ